MRLITPDMMKDLPKNIGSISLFYGLTGVGKTTSIFASAPEPLLYIPIEQRDWRRSFEEAHRPDLKFSVAIYENWMDFIKFLNDFRNFEGFNSIAIDSTTYMSEVSLYTEIADEQFASREDKKASDKPLTSQTKLSQEGYGGLADQMARMMIPLGRLSMEHGKFIILTALEEQSPSWDRGLSAAPALAGKKFPSIVPGWLDLIGKVERRYDAETGGITFPPLVRFEPRVGENNRFVCKWTGARPRYSDGTPVDVIETPMNISKIVGYKNGA